MRIAEENPSDSRVEKLVDRARRAVVNSYTVSHMSRGSVPYRKTKSQRVKDHALAVLLCTILVDDLDYRPGDVRQPEELFHLLLHEAIESNELVEPAPGKTWVHRKDIQWLDRDDVPVRGYR